MNGFLIGLCSIIVFGAGLACAETAEGTLGRELDRYVAGQAERGYSGVVLVARGETILLHKGYGLANRKAPIPNGTETVFDIGSISKMITAVAILRLEMAGKLNTGDTLSKIFEKVPADKAGITIAQLLSHTAGLQNFHDTRGDFEKMDREKALAEIFKRELRFEVGEKFGYSNSGFTLLALIVERVSNQPFQAYLQQELFEPAGMTHTGFYGDPRWTEANTAHGYLGKKDKGSPRAWPGPFWALLGNGGMVCTALDLFKLHRALETKTLLDEARLRAMREPRVGFDSRSRGTVSVGFGLMMSETVLGKTLEHGGANDFGFSAFYCFFPERDTVTIVTANATEGENFPVRPVSEGLHKLLFETNGIP